MFFLQAVISRFCGTANNKEKTRSSAAEIYRYSFGTQNHVLLTKQCAAPENSTNTNVNAH